MISLATYDPRPLEPDWVRFGEDDEPGQLDWQVISYHWNRETKKYDALEDCGNTIEELIATLDYVYVNGLMAEATVDATEMGDPVTPPAPRDTVAWKAKCEDNTGMWTIVTFSDCTEETLSNDDALFFIETAIYNREKITVDISHYDPTP